MRIAAGMLASAAILFSTGALGVLATWALVVGVVLSVASAITAAVVMEERDQLPDGSPVEAAYLPRVEHLT